MDGLPGAKGRRIVITTARLRFRIYSVWACTIMPTVTAHTLDDSQNSTSQVMTKDPRSRQDFPAGGGDPDLSLGLDASGAFASGVAEGVADFGCSSFFPAFPIPVMFAWSSALIPGMFE